MRREKTPPSCYLKILERQCDIGNIDRKRYERIKKEFPYLYKTVDTTQFHITKNNGPKKSQY